MKQRNMFISEEQKQKVKAHNSFSNDVVGVFAFSMGISALASSTTTGLATIAFVFCCVWMIYKAVLIYTSLKRTSQGVSFWDHVFSGIPENLIFLLGLGFLCSVALGIVTTDVLKSWSLASVLDSI
jgi:hypothetical protein